MISTDSESGLTSPQHSITNNCKSPVRVDVLESMTTSCSTQESIKLTIRTKDAKICSNRFEKSNASISNASSSLNKHSKLENVGESSRAARASRRNQQKNKFQNETDSIEKTQKLKSSPQPGSEHYELYCTLASPDRDGVEKIQSTTNEIKEQQRSSDTEIKTKLHIYVEPEQYNEEESDIGNTFDMNSKSSLYNKSSKTSSVLRCIGQKHKNSSVENTACSSAKYVCNEENNVLESETLSDKSTKQDDMNVVTTTVNYNDEYDKPESSNWYGGNKPEIHQSTSVDNNSLPIEAISIDVKTETTPVETPPTPSVKLVISKKKGSIFKSRALVNDGSNTNSKKRHVYRHKCWQFDEQVRIISLAHAFINE